MKILFLILTFTLAASAQELVSADKAVWKRIAVGYPENEKKFNLWVATPISGSRGYPVVKARQDAGPIRTVRIDCRSGEFKYDTPGAEWTKAPRGSVGALLLKFACK